MTHPQDPGRGPGDDPGRGPGGRFPEDPAAGPPRDAPGGPGAAPGGGPDGAPGRTGEIPRTGRGLRTAGQLVEGGGAAGALATLAYVVIGIGFWSLVGWGADRVLGTRWIVVLGACIGAASGIYVVYLHMQAALRRDKTSGGADPHHPHQSGPDSAPRP
ncbi:AtpZ/AtpI family protein [Kocuria flava]|uniref:AtpZ/AtpI family protein n=1 Tax=Kocuria flava TaxID=446860 RepID=UPI001FF319E4|nr:AtpZ/AtpI family protein [Kocuria flava]MCJ8505105.1 AtpZ/AtpI family protein [Kocuria flava]